MKLLIFLLPIFYACKSYSQDHYIDPDKLSWLDYRGQIDYSKNSWAYTWAKYDIVVPPNAKSVKDLDVKIVFCSFVSFVDWQILIKKTKEESEYLFSHERIHYCIMILVAKRLKYFLKHQLKFSPTELPKNIDAFNTMANSLSSAYDSETQHSLNHVKQAEWSSKISKSLDSLKGIQLIMQ